MEEQGKELMLMANIAVNGLDRLEAIMPSVKLLGVRHVGYGVKDRHYDTVGAALLWTLGQGFGDRYTPPGRGSLNRAVWIPGKHHESGGGCCRLNNLMDITRYRSETP